MISNSVKLKSNLFKHQLKFRKTQRDSSCVTNSSSSPWCSRPFKEQAYRSKYATARNNKLQNLDCNLCGLAGLSQIVSEPVIHERHGNDIRAWEQIGLFKNFWDSHKQRCLIPAFYNTNFFLILLIPDGPGSDPEGPNSGPASVLKVQVQGIHFWDMTPIFLLLIL